MWKPLEHHLFLKENDLQLALNSPAKSPMALLLGNDLPQGFPQVSAFDGWRPPGECHSVTHWVKMASVSGGHHQYNAVMSTCYFRRSVHPWASQSRFHLGIPTRIQNRSVGQLPQTQPENQPPNLRPPSEQTSSAGTSRSSELKPKRTMPTRSKPWPMVSQNVPKIMGKPRKGVLMFLIHIFFGSYWVTE